MTDYKIKLFLLVAFALSGMAALMYEVIWARQLTLIFGTTLYAVSTVLAVFMAGLALGSLIFGRIADKSKNPLRVYAYLEGGIGVYVLFTPLIFMLISNAQIYFAHNFSIDFTSFSLIRFGLSFIALIIPATLMGGTLPVIVKFFVRTKSELGGYVGKLYALNTLGGVLGSFLVGFALVLLLGVQGTIYLAVAINVLVAAVVFWISRNFVLEPVQGIVSRGLTPGNRGKADEEGEYAIADKTVLLVFIAFGFAGFAALSLEASWSRVLAMILGSSVYAFSIILTTFLSGIALGSFIISRFIDRIKNFLLWFAAIEIAIGISVILFTPLLGYLPHLYLKVFKITGGSFWPLQFMEFLLAGLVMLLPAILMGAAFPIVAKICAREFKKIGRSVGNVYFVNTFGAIFGPLVSGFIFIPFLGLQTSILIAAYIYVAIGALVFLLIPFQKLAVKIFVAGLVALVIISGYLIPSWNKNILNSGVYVYAQKYLQQDSKLSAVMNEQLFYKEGLTATVAVEKNKGGNLFLTIDGKGDAGTSADMDTQLILGHLPMLLHRDPKEVLIIGLGSGITLGAVEQYDELETVDAVEIEPAVVEAASYFSKFNNNALQDSRLNLVVGDGRNYVLTTEKKYDVISAEPSNPWMSGNSKLFTKEQFELYKERLKPGGIMFQWAHIYKLRHDEVKTILATFGEVFPHTVLWQNFSGRDIFMIGSENPLKIDFAALQEKMNREKIKKDLARANLDDPFLFLNYSVLNEEGVKAFAQGAKIHTNNNPILEFQAPKGMYIDAAMIESVNLEALEKYRTNVFTLLSDIDDIPEPTQKKIAVAALARTHIMQGEIIFSRGDPTQVGVEEYKKALSLGTNILAEKRLGEIFFNTGELYFLNGMYGEAEGSYIDAITWDPGELDYYTALASAYIRQGDGGAAIYAYERALEVDPDDLYSRTELGILYGRAGLLVGAEEEFKLILARDDKNYFAHNNLANVYRMQGRVEDAILQYEKSLEIKPKQEEVKDFIFELRGAQ